MRLSLSKDPDDYRGGGAWVGERQAPWIGRLAAGLTGPRPPYPVVFAGALAGVAAAVGLAELIDRSGWAIAPLTVLAGRTLAIAAWRRRAAAS